MHFGTPSKRGFSSSNPPPGAGLSTQPPFSLSFSSSFFAVSSLSSSSVQLNSGFLIDTRVRRRREFRCYLGSSRHLEQRCTSPLRFSSSIARRCGNGRLPALSRSVVRDRQRSLRRRRCRLRCIANARRRSQALLPIVEASKRDRNLPQPPHLLHCKLEREMNTSSDWTHLDCCAPWGRGGGISQRKRRGVDVEGVRAVAGLQRRR
jgi:hypothetical protein